MNISASLVLVALSWHLFGVSAVGVWQSSRMTAKRFQFIWGLIFGCLKGSYAMWLAAEDPHTVTGPSRDFTLAGRMWSDMSFFTCLPIPLAWAISLAYSTETVKAGPTSAARNTTVITSISYGCLLLAPFGVATIALRFLSPTSNLDQDLIALSILNSAVWIIGVYLLYAMYRLMLLHGNGWRGFATQFPGLAIFGVVYVNGAVCAALLVIVFAIEGWPHAIVIDFAHIACVGGVTVALIVELRVTMRTVLDARGQPVAVAVAAPDHEHSSVDADGVKRFKHPTPPYAVGGGSPPVSPPAAPLAITIAQADQLGAGAGAVGGASAGVGFGSTAAGLAPPPATGLDSEAKETLFSTALPGLVSPFHHVATPPIRGRRISPAPGSLAAGTTTTLELAAYEKSGGSGGSGAGGADATLMMEVDEARSNRWSGDAFFVRCVELRLSLKHIIALFVIGVTVSIVAFVLLNAYNLSHDVATFKAMCHQLSSSMQDQLAFVLKGPIGLGSLVSALSPSEQVTSAVYSAYETQTSDTVFGTSSVFARLLRNETERLEFESAPPHVNLSYFNVNTNTRYELPRFARADYLPVEYVRFPIYYGFDLFSHYYMNTTARAVLRTGQALSTPPYPLITSHGIGWLIVTPVFKNYSLGLTLSSEWMAASTAGPSASATVDILEGRTYDNMIGISWTAINAAGLLAHVKTLAPDIPVRMALYLAGDPLALAVEEVDFALKTELTRSEYFQFTGGRYELRCDISAPFVDYHITPRVLLATMLLFTVMLCTLLWGTVLARRRLVLRYADIRDAHAAKDSAINMLKQARKDADEANQSKSQFMSYLCHELRNPLHVIMSMLDLLFESPAYAGLPAPDHLSFKTIRSSAMVMSTLFNDVLDMSKIEAGKMSIEARSFDVRKLIDTLVVENRPAGNDPQLVSNIDPSVPQWIISDPLRIRQIILNLIQNAIKFTATGFVRVNVSTVAADEVKIAPAAKARGGETKMIHFAVEDTGIGLTEAAMKKLFDPFEQCKASVAREYGGTGLGLSIVRALTEVLGGTVRVRSRIGHGTTFTIELLAEIGKPTISPPPIRPLPPIERVPAVEHSQTRIVASTTTTAALPAGSPSTTGNGTPVPVLVPVPSSLAIRIRLLVVDDSEINLRIMTTILNRPGVEVAVARNGFEAIEAVLSAASHVMNAEATAAAAVATGSAVAGTGEAVASSVTSGSAASDAPADLRKDPKLLPYVNRAFDFVFMDIAMPLMDGIEATRQLRTVWNCQTPIVAVTANALASDRDKCITAGVSDFLPKPFRREQIYAVLQKYAALFSDACGPLSTN